MIEIIKEILNEPRYEDESTCPKTVFLTEFLEAKGSEEWLGFVNFLSEAVSNIVCEKQSKLFPANQYEECQKKWNYFLSHNDVMLKQKLVVVCNSQIVDSLAGRLVFRIGTKMFHKAQTWVLQQLQKRRLEEATSCGIVFKSMSEMEEKNFLIYLGDLFRKFFQKCASSQVKRWIKQSECMKVTFVDGPHPISSKEFLNKSYWFSGTETSIEPSVHASSFFKAIENVIMPARNSSATQEVIEEILLRPEVLNHWYVLTHAYLTEDVALVFMRDLVSVYLKFSVRLEEKKLNRAEERAAQATAVALRDHLKRNYDKDDEGEEDVDMNRSNDKGAEGEKDVDMNRNNDKDDEEDNVDID